jgi:hypothetical protein
VCVRTCERVNKGILGFRKRSRLGSAVAAQLGREGGPGAVVDVCHGHDDRIWKEIKKLNL